MEDQALIRFLNLLERDTKNLSKKDHLRLPQADGGENCADGWNRHAVKPSLCQAYEREASTS
jgi:hypothetical protein